MLINIMFQLHPSLPWPKINAEVTQNVLTLRLTQDFDTEYKCNECTFLVLLVVYSVFKSICFLLALGFIQLFHSSKGN